MTALGVDGLLGANFLRDYAMVLDFSKQECTFAYPGNVFPTLLATLGFDAAKDGAVSLPGGDSWHYQIPLLLNGKNEQWALDLYKSLGM